MREPEKRRTFRKTVQKQESYTLEGKDDGMSFVDSNRDVRRDVRPQYIRFWLPCGMFAIIGTVIRSEFIFPLLIVGAWLFAAARTSEAVASWEQVRDNQMYADIADRDKFIQFTLKGNLVAHVVFECAIIAVDVVLFLLLNHLDGLASITMALFFLILTVSQYYFFMTGRALLRDISGTNRYPDGSDYIPRITFAQADEQYRKVQVEFARKQQEVQAQNAAEEAKRAEEKRKADESEQRAREASEAERALRITEYEHDNRPGRRRVWEWLNIGWNLDFPDEVCDIIADYTYGRTDGITGRKLKELLSDVMPEDEAAQYAQKFDSVRNAVRKLRSEEENREAIEAQTNPLGVEGEANVNYTLKWWLSSHPGYIMVASDCFSQYSASCIRLAAWDFVREPQEIDHLLVGPAGVIHIETKDYIGSIDVQTTTYWRRDKGNDGQYIPFNSPAFQVNRHDVVIKHIVGPDIPVRAVICLANKNVELLHAEKSDIPIVCLRDMENFLNNLDSSEANRLDDTTVQKVYQQIEDAKVRNSKKRAEYEKARAGKR